jgi:hypothetical protein
VRFGDTANKPGKTKAEAATKPPDLPFERAPRWQEREKQRGPGSREDSATSLSKSVGVDQESCFIKASLITFAWL